MRPLAVSLLAVLAFTHPAAAAPHAGDTYGDWIVSCEPLEGQEHERCYITQVVSLRESGQRVLHFAIGRVPGSERTVATVTVPLGTFLPAGLGLSVDGGETVGFATFQFCLDSGCRRVLALDDAITRLLKAGRQGQVVYQDRQRRPIRVPLSLLGLNEGLAALDE